MMSDRSLASMALDNMASASGPKELQFMARIRISDFFLELLIFYR